MKLINTTTGTVIEITDVNNTLNRVVFVTQEFNSVKSPCKANSHTYNNFSINAAYNIESALIRLCYEALKLEVFPTFKVSENENWLFPLRPIRVYIPDGIVKSATNSGNALGQLLMAMQSDIPAEFRKATETGVVTYLELLLPEHRAIMEAYPEIILEEKA